MAARSVLFDAIDNKNKEKATREGNFDFLKIVDANRNEINARNEKGRTPLMEVMATNLRNSVPGLIRRGASVDVQDHRGYYPLHMAVLGQYLPAVKALVETQVTKEGRKFFVNRVSDRGFTALHLSVGENNSKRIGSEDIVRYLLDQGASVSARDDQGNTPLMIAANSHGSETIRKLLIERGADEELVNDEGWTASAIAKKLRKQDSEMKVKSKTRDVASSIRTLLGACMEGDSAIVSDILKENPKLRNVVTGSGKTLPEFVSYHGNSHLLPIVRK